MRVLVGKEKIEVQTEMKETLENRGRWKATSGSGVGVRGVERSSFGVQDTWGQKHQKTFHTRGCSRYAYNLFQKNTKTKSKTNCKPKKENE